MPFDDQNSGRQLRDSYPNTTKKYREFNGTPIYRYKHEYSLKTKGGKFLGAKAKVIQFPLSIMHQLLTKCR